MESRQQLAETIATLCDVEKIKGFKYMSKVELLDIYNRCKQYKEPVNNTPVDSDSDSDEDTSNDTDIKKGTSVDTATLQEDNMDIYNKIMVTFKKHVSKICLKMGKMDIDKCGDAGVLLDEYKRVADIAVSEFNKVLDDMGAGKNSYLNKHAMSCIDDGSDRICDLYDFFNAPQN